MAGATDSVDEPSLSSPLSRTAFGRLVRDALAHLWDIPYLHTHPLSRALEQQRGGGPSLEELLREAIESLRPAPGSSRGVERAERRHHLFKLRYIDGLTRREVEQELRCQQSEYYRLQNHGLEAIIRFLHEHIYRNGQGSPRPSQRYSAAALASAGGEHSRRTRLVGRDAQLEQLRYYYRRTAARSQGLTVFIGGEPGVGKTRLADELGRYAAAEGGLFLRSAYLRDGVAAYGAWSDLLRQGLKTMSQQEAIALAGPYAGELAWLLPELAAGGTTQPLPSPVPEEQRYRLFDAIAMVLGALGERSPVVALLDDLQWAPGLAVLTQVARRLADRRVLLLGAYRDLEFEGRPAAARRRDELVRARLATGVRLEPLDAARSAEMVASILDDAAAEQLAGSVYRSSHGNPLFIEEVLRSLAQQGALRNNGTSWELADPSRTVVPATLAQVVNERVARIGPGADAVFARAAVLGAEFSFDVLQELTGFAEDALFDLLERAMEARLIVDRSTAREERFAFADDQFQEVLYQAIPAPRRRRLHVQAGQAAEAVYGEGLDPHAPELARHLSHSTDRSVLARALHYATAAARAAEAAYAYTEAAVNWQRALGILETLDPHDLQRRCEMLLALGEAKVMSQEPASEIETVAQQALTLAESLQDAGRASRACRLVLTPRVLDGAPGFASKTWERWTQPADRYAEPGTVDRVYADLALAGLHEARSDFAGERALLQRALSLARRLDSSPAFFSACARLLRRMSPRYWQETIHLAKEMAARPREGVELGPIPWALRTCSMVFTACGERERLDAMLFEIREQAARTRDRLLQLDTLYADSLTAHLDGDLETAVETGYRLMRRANEIGRASWGRRFAANLMLRPLLYLGRGEEALELLQRLRAEQGTGKLLADTVRRAVCLAHIGRLGEAGMLLRQLVAELPAGAGEDQAVAGILTELLETAVLTGDREAAGRLVRPLRPLAGAPSAGGWTFTPVGRHLGAAAAMLGNETEAASYYREALAACEKLGFRPEAALTRLELAELQRGREHAEEQPAGLEPLIRELREMKMTPALQRALSLQRRR